MSFSASDQAFDIGLGLEDVHVLITGGCGLIGSVVVRAFLAAGSKVTVIDFAKAHPFSSDEWNLLVLQGSITDISTLDDCFNRAESTFGPVQTCIALASLDLSVLPQTESICDADPAEWQRVFDVNIHGTFLTAQRWLRGVRAAQFDRHAAGGRNVGLVLVGSEAGRFGVRTMAAYAAAKSAVQGGLLLSLAQDAPRVWAGARVNAVAPGAVDTVRLQEEIVRYGEEWRWKECVATVPLARPVPPEEVARTILFLASERYSGSVHGQVIPIDAGKNGIVAWTMDEISSKSSH